MFFSDEFNVATHTLEDYGAFNVSLINDLPLFIDPFLLFNSEKEEYQEIHGEMIRYIIHLRDLARNNNVTEATLRGLFTFPEIRQNWFGFSLSGNAGKGLGMSYARSLNQGFLGPLATFGDENISAGTHIEKLCIIHPGTGRDFISDFSTNMALGYLASFTEKFAKLYLRDDQCKLVPLRRASFSYQTGSWVTRPYQLPWLANDFVLLTPIDLLTKDDTWISANNLYGDFDGIVDALPNEVLREQINQYFEALLVGKDELTKDEYNDAISQVLQQWPEVIDYYIRAQEQIQLRMAAAMNALKSSTWIETPR